MTSRITQVPTINLNVTIQLTEQEVRALEAIAGYGDKAFLEVFYKHMGRHYLEPHEAGIRSLFAVIRSDLNPILERVKAAKTAFALDRPVIRSRADHDEFVEQLKQQGAKP